MKGARRDNEEGVSLAVMFPRGMTSNGTGIAPYLTIVELLTTSPLHI